MIAIDDNPTMDPVEWGKVLLSLDPPIADQPVVYIHGALLTRLCDVGDDWARDLDAVLTAQAFAWTIDEADLSTHRVAWSGGMFARLVAQAEELRTCV